MSRTSGFAPVAANRARRVYVHLDATAPAFHCIEALHGAARMGIVLPDGSFADLIGYRETPQKAAESMQMRGYRQLTA